MYFINRQKSMNALIILSLFFSACAPKNETALEDSRLTRTDIKELPINVIIKKSTNVVKHATSQGPKTDLNTSQPPDLPIVAMALSKAMKNAISRCI